jgi:universal stress protein E
VHTIRQMLVAVKDTEATSFPAVDKAIQLAKAFGASLELYHAIATPVYVDFELVDTTLQELKRSRRQGYQRRLDSLASRARTHGVQVTTAVGWDYPAHEAIVRRATRIKADLIVAECHAGRRVAPWLVHLTDWELLRTSPVPVLLIKSKARYERPIVLAAVDPTHLRSKPAKLDEGILNTGAHFTRALSGSLHALHAYFPVSLDVPTSKLASSVSSGRLYAQVRARARAAFERTVQKARIPRARRHLVDRHPIDAIPATAREIGADLVVMGAVSRSGLQRIFIGNTAEHVLGALDCDVLVVKPRRFTRRVAREQRGVRLVGPAMSSVY